jgi:hypothetical protein
MGSYVQAEGYSAPTAHHHLPIPCTLGLSEKNGRKMEREREEGNYIHYPMSKGIDWLTYGIKRRNT